ncbi:MAG TPA: T9SS type A sorting domain-containing protein [Caldithrix abyssi]|uniref:T9SS type A sorting domain-containing protein n=1 Tax=Caldithrix abyssi TaxID=187145 RepID=A0A7V4UD34_CALAY|nr:T9SS type A sorting domain-containing protein [Caldithrix abyssi]
MKCFTPVQQMIVAFSVILFSTSIMAQNLKNYEGCTIGAAAGKATSDGRPLIWKTTDGPGSDREITSVTNEKYYFICDNLPGRLGTTSMGINEKGFAILNSQSGDLPGGNSGYGNTAFMWAALGKCATLSDLEHFLDSTNVTGRRTTTNFATLDSTGAVAIYEVSGDQYWKFDANDSTIAPDGYIIRTNFSINGGGGAGLDRFNRSTELIADFYSGDSLSYKSILRYQMRDFSDWESNPIQIPYTDQWNSETPFGYIYTGNSICRFPSLSSAVFQGVLPGEPAKLSTMWEVLGQPASTIAVPYWPVGKTPELVYNSPTARLCNISLAIKKFLFDYPQNENYIDTYKLRDEDDNGLWFTTFPAEDSIRIAAEAKLQQWRSGSFSIEEMLAAESEFAQYAYTKLRTVHDNFLTFNRTNILVSKSFSPYSEIVPDSVLASGDDTQSTIQLPFLFEYDGIKYDKIQVSTNGWLEFGKGEAGSDSGLSTSAQLAYVGAVNNERLATTDHPTKALAPWWDDLMTSAEGEIGIKTEGVSPERKVIVQWKNMQAYSSAATAQLNFQVHLHESANEIEFHYGTLSEGTYSGNGASVGFKDLRGGALRFYDLIQDKICYKDELIADLDPNSDWPGPDSCFTINTYATPTAIPHVTASMTQNSHLSQNYPNPFNPKTTINYELSITNYVELNIYNVLGQKVAVLVSEKQQPGSYKVEWNASGFASGIYYYRLKTEQDFIQTRKLVILK